MLRLSSGLVSLVIAATSLIAPISVDAVHALRDQGGATESACKEISSELSGESAVFFPGG